MPKTCTLLAIICAFLSGSGLAEGKSVYAGNGGGSVIQAGDEICDAEDLGTVPLGGSVQTPLLSRSNTDASNTNDPVPPSWGSDKTVWFKFVAPASGHIQIDANSDLIVPIGMDPIDIQLAVYETSDHTCTGSLSHVGSEYVPLQYDEDLELRCLNGGQTYWVLLDGSNADQSGIFDIKITDGGDTQESNNSICSPIQLGEPASGGTVGLNDQRNYCSDQLAEPQPVNWINDQGVWFTFLAPTSGAAEVRLDTDPTETIDLQVAVFDLSGSCSNPAIELASQYDGSGLLHDEDLFVECLTPGQEYWILVDGHGSVINPDRVEGEFDIEVYGDPRDAPLSNDSPCNATALGDPTGSSVGTTPGVHGSQNNYCATATGEPQPSAFSADQSVWYTFIGPGTGAVNIDLSSDNIISGTDPIDLQLAVYSASTCSGTFTEIKSGEDLNYDVDMDVWCLTDGELYYVQVDGAPPVLDGIDEGYFDITISEIPAVPSAGNDDICSATSLGDPWAATTTLLDQNNFCANNSGDSTPIAFAPDQSVWYSVSTPTTGGPYALQIAAVSDLAFPFGVDAVDLQVAAFESSDNTCSGTLTEVSSGYDPAALNDTLVVSCLQANKTYFVMINGSSVNHEGYFDVIASTTSSGNLERTQTVQACNSYEWIDGNTYTSDNSSATHLVSGTGGCDTLYTLNLAIFTGYKWLGQTSADWNTANNWCSGSVPTSSDDVTILASATNQPHVTSDPASPATCNSLTIEDGATLTIDAGKALTASGTTDNDGTFLIKADATGVGSFIDNGTISGDGTFQMEQYVTGAGGSSPSGVFWYVSTAVTGAKSYAFNAGGTDRLWSAYEPAQYYTEIGNDSTSLQAGDGYITRQGATATLIHEGTGFNTGNFVKSVTNSGTGETNGYNLLGNPYPSSVDWESFNFGSGDFSTTVWYRTKSGSTMLVDTYNGTTHIGTNNNGGGAVTRYISPGQAFWVRNIFSFNTENWTFENSVRSHQDVSLLRSASVTDVVRIAISGNGVSDEHVVVFNPLASDQFDEYDSNKLYGSDSQPYICSRVEGQDLTMNGLSSPTANPSVPLKFFVPQSGSYSIDGLEFTDPFMTVVLEDSHLGVFQDLQQNPTYSFSSSPGWNSDRFILHFNLTITESEEEATTEFRVFSNNHGLNIHLGVGSNGNYTVMDMTGKVVEKGSLNSNRSILKLDLVPGVYVVQLVTSTAIYSKQIRLD